jgi:hypothetical protein
MQSPATALRDTRPVVGVDWTVDTAIVYNKVRHPKTILQAGLAVSHLGAVVDRIRRFSGQLLPTIPGAARGRGDAVVGDRES